MTERINVRVFDYKYQQEEIFPLREFFGMSYGIVRE
jgi:hypothetical protein